MEISNESYAFLEANNNLCRVCLSASDKNKCIFTTHLIVDPESQRFQGLREELQFYGGIEVVQNDGLPNKICDKCISVIIVAHNFRMQCQDTDKKLRAIHKNVGSENNVDFEASIKKAVEIEMENGLKTIALCNEEEFSQEKVIAREQVSAQEFPPETLKKTSSDEFCEVWSNNHKILCDPVDTKISEVVQNFKNRKHDFPRPTRRLTMSKRMTSMESLKSRKEQRRCHIKKTILQKNNDREIKKKGQKNRVPHQISNDPEKSLADHKLSRDYENYSCNQCNERFSRLPDLTNHSKSHICNDKFIPANCKICKKKFRKASTMLRHLNIHKRDNPRAVYTILKEIREARRKKCIKENDTMDILQEKPRIVDPERCKKLLKDYNSSNELSINCNINESEENSLKSENAILQCASPIDEGMSIKLINRWLREELDSDVEGKGFPCSYCEKSYVTKKSLIKHIGNIHENCDICDESQNCKGHVEDFGEQLLFENKKTTYSCNECEKMFETESKLKKHSRIHVREKEDREKNFKRFLCHICSKTFRQNTGLMFHMRTHTGYKPHVCKYCGRGFTSNSNCMNHERTHTGDRPFVCHFCSAAFAKSCTLKAHITTHTGEANYHCKTCDKSFRRLKYLKEHRYTHTGEKPYACKLCGTAYSHSGSLFVHEKKCKAQFTIDNTMDSYRNDTMVNVENSSIRNLDIPISSIENKHFLNKQNIGETENYDIHADRSNVHMEDTNFLINGI